MTITTHRTSFFCALLAAFAILAISARADTIFVAGGNPLTGVLVISESIEKVEYKKRDGSGGSVPGWQVTMIVYDAAPRAMRQGFEHYSNGRYADAIDSLKIAGAIVDEDLPWLVPYARYYLGRSYLALGRSAEAIETFEKLFESSPETRFAVPATLAVLTAAIAKPDPGAADRALSRFRAIVASKKLPPATADEVELASTDLWIFQKNDKAAVDVVKSLVTATATEPGRAGVAYRARAREIEATIAGGNVAAAERLLADLEARAKDGGPEARAAAAIGRARVAVASGKDLYAALWALSRSRIENHSALSEMPTTCYLLGLVNEKVGREDPRAKDAAKGYFLETISRWPESRAAVAARAVLKN